MMISDDEDMSIGSKAWLRRLFNRIQRRKRTLRVPFDPSSPSEQANNVKREERHAVLGGFILGFSPPPPPPPEPTRNRKRERSPLSSSVQRQQQRPKTNPPLSSSVQQQQQQQPRVTLCLAIRPIDPTPVWLLPWMARKNGTNPRKVIEKALTKTDVCSTQNRLSIPLRRIVDIGFLRPEEKRIVEEDSKVDKLKGLDVKLMVSDEKEFPLNLRRWKMNNTSTYNLVTGWYGVVKACGLTSGYMIDLWSFRSDNKVYFAFVPPTLPQNPN